MKQNELKYQNTTWLRPVYNLNQDFALGVSHVHNAICLADDITDRAISVIYAKDCLVAMIEGVGILMQYPDFFVRLKPVLAKIYESEALNLEFIPGKKDIEEELKIWGKRSSLFDLYFTSWCCVDPSIDTKKNWEWFEQFKAYALIMDDCSDILNDEFEDLTQCKRNYVVLTEYGLEGYTGWRNRKEELKKKAKEIAKRIQIAKPEDKRMMIYLSGE